MEKFKVYHGYYQQGSYEKNKGYVYLAGIHKKRTEKKQRQNPEYFPIPKIIIGFKIAETREIKIRYAKKVNKNTNRKNYNSNKIRRPKITAWLDNIQIVKQD